jgi:putative ABC transport system permease protein
VAADGDPPLFEGGLSVRSADVLGITAEDVEAGRTIRFSADASDALAPPGGAIAIRFTGIFESTTPVEDPYWFDDRSLLVPRIRPVSRDDTFSDIGVAVPAESYAAMAAAAPDGSLSMRYAWRYLVDPGRLTIDGLEGLAGDLHSLEGLFRDGETQIGDATLSALRSRLVRLVDEHVAEWRSADVALITAGMGPVGLAVGALAFLAVVSAQRRTRLLRASQARGASILQMVAMTLVECLVLAVPPAALGAVLAIVLVPDTRTGPTITAAAGVALVTTVLLVGAVTIRFASSLRVRPDSEPSRWARHRRLVAEGLVVGLAAAGTFFLLERGVRGATSAGQIASADLLLAAAPALVALAAGVIAARLFPAAVGFVARLFDRRRDLVPVLALRRASREGGSTPILIVLVAAAMIATFSAAMLAHLERASVDIAWHQVGSAHRIVVDQGSLPAGFDVSGIAEVEASAPAFRARGARTSQGAVELLALDAVAFRRVVEGTPADVDIDPLLLDDQQPIPAAIVSSSLMDGAGAGAVELDVPVQLRLGGRPVQVLPVQWRDTFPTLPTDRPFIVASLAQLRAAHPEQPLAPDMLFVRAPDDAGAALSRRVDEVAGARLESRAALSARLAGSPVMIAVVTGVAASALMAAGYAVVAVAAAIALRGSARMVETAHLRTLGLKRGEAVRLSMAEHGAPTLIAFVVGSVTGLAMFSLVRGSVGLAALLGSALDIRAPLQIVHLAALLGALTLVSAAGIAVGAAAERRATPSTEIRRGFET